MKRRAFVLIALVAGALALAACRPADANEPTPVILDPLDFRQPIPDPEHGLTQKYDGKVVRWTGAVTSLGLNKATKKYTYLVSHDLVQYAPAKKGKKPVVVSKETISMTVTFHKPEKEFQKQAERLLKAKRPGPAVTVEGKATVHPDGSVDITDAVIYTGKRPFGR